MAAKKRVSAQISPSPASSSKVGAEGGSPKAMFFFVCVFVCVCVRAFLSMLLF
jgi:hypothetical protein